MFQTLQRKPLGKSSLGAGRCRSMRSRRTSPCHCLSTAKNPSTLEESNWLCGDPNEDDVAISPRDTTWSHLDTMKHIAVSARAFVVPHLCISFRMRTCMDCLRRPPQQQGPCAKSASSLRSTCSGGGGRGRKTSSPSRRYVKGDFCNLASNITLSVSEASCLTRPRAHSETLCLRPDSPRHYNLRDRDACCQSWKDALNTCAAKRLHHQALPLPLRLALLPQVLPLPLCQPLTFCISSRHHCNFFYGFWCTLFACEKGA